MNRHFLTLVLIFLFSSNRVYAQSNTAAEFKFLDSKHDFGDMIEGEQKEHSFEFTNTGQTPLIISKIIATCGCTAPTWPKDPIKPGEKGKIKIVFNSTGKIGRQNKVVTILSNASNQKERLHIMANVIPRSGK
jgi:hypothetical protein